MDNETMIEIGGGADGGAGSDGGAGDGGGAEDQSTEFADQGGAEGSEGADGGDGTQDDSQDQGGASDGAGRGAAYSPKQFKEDLAAIKAVNPKAAQQFEKAFWKVQNVNKLGTFQQLSALKEAADLYGGAEGISELAEEVEGARALEQGFQAGDPKIIDGWAKDYPDGFKKLIVPAFDKLETLDGKAWEGAAATVATKFFDKFGVFDHVQAIGAAIGKLQGNEEAVRLFNDLVGKVLKPMSTMGRRSATDPLASEREAVERQKQENLTESQKIFYGQVRQTVNTEVTGKINAALRAFLGNRRLDSSQGNRIRGEINRELNRLVNTDPNYQRQYKVIMGSANHDRAAKFITTRANAKVTIAVRKVLADFNLMRRPNGQGGGQGGNGNGQRQDGGGQRRAAPPRDPNKVSQVGARPAFGDVDWTRTDKAQWILPHGTVTLRSGQKVKW